MSESAVERQVPTHGFAVTRRRPTPIVPPAAAVRSFERRPKIVRRRISAPRATGALEAVGDNDDENRTGSDGTRIDNDDGNRDRDGLRS
ncbi:hypothetical protein Hbl1158_01365 [Halobaculum sp. CBA1158]|uniref:hypothetical protein n=1 Tax=Halobaculum sp. CBA1158 TaxID=2904243 RepID=UPI001F1FCEE7|nr:hypothetical protein [Halobaculum sp. CBA1158]UIP00049.1 hypothetical protein Hbl1158_01365 [Halobaculum sp. CBA1158]